MQEHGKSLISRRKLILIDTSVCLTSLAVHNYLYEKINDKISNRYGRKFAFYLQWEIRGA